jgi:2-oxoglutarate ferredoxin oxidoreductase subunit alpha
MGKLDVIAREIPESFKFRLAGPRDAELTLISWGSTKGAILDAMPALGRSVNFLHLRLMRPFPAAEVGKILGAARTTILIEPNYSGQLGALIREQTGVLPAHRILKYDGRPFSRNEVVEGVEAVLTKNAKEWMVSHA